MYFSSRSLKLISLWKYMLSADEAKRSPYESNSVGVQQRVKFIWRSSAGFDTWKHTVIYFWNTKRKIFYLFSILRGDQTISPTLFGLNRSATNWNGSKFSWRLKHWSCGRRRNKKKNNPNTAPLTCWQSCACVAMTAAGAVCLVRGSWGSIRWDLSQSTFPSLVITISLSSLRLC